MMFASRKFYSGWAAACALGALAGGCGSVGDFGLGGQRRRQSWASRQRAQSPDMPERRKLVMPASECPAARARSGRASAAADGRPRPSSRTSRQRQRLRKQQKDSGSWFSGITGVFGSKTQ